MLKDTLFRVPRTTGLCRLHRRGEGDARELTSWRLRLDAGGVERYAAPGEETIVVLQEGRGTFECGDERWRVSRSGVFTERATALLLPPGRALAVRADTPLEAILISAPAPDGGAPVLVQADDVQAQTRGRDTFTRDVHNVFVTDTHARRLLGRPAAPVRPRRARQAAPVKRQRAGAVPARRLPAGGHGKRMT